MHRGAVHADAVSILRGHPTLEVAVKLGTEEVGDEYVYIEMSLPTREHHRIESTIYHLYPYIHTVTFDRPAGRENEGDLMIH